MLSIINRLVYAFNETVGLISVKSEARQFVVLNWVLLELT